ncbi:MAG: hypothetical protein ABI947_17955, partial [Chloroflexota bacterium]
MSHDDTVTKFTKIPRRVWLLALAFAALTTLPYLVALFSAPHGTTFSGVFPLNAVDYNSHLAKMQQGMQGAWLYQLLFTAEPHPPILLQTFYIALGHLARWTGLSLDLVYHLSRIVFSALLVPSIWIVMRRFLSESLAWWALLLSLFSGGLSWLLLFINPAITGQISPIEFWLLDAYTFLAAFVSPHFAAGMVLLALAFAALDDWTETGAGRSLIGLFLAGIGIALLQPFHLLLLDTTLVLVAVWRMWHKRLVWWQGIVGLTLIGVSHAALVGYDLLMFQQPIWRSFSEQNITLSPPPIFYVLGYAPILLPAVGGIGLALRRRDERWLVPALWVLLVSVLVYAPLATQRRFTLGIQIPLAMLATYALSNMATFLARRRIKRSGLLRLLYGALAMMSTLLVLFWLLGTTRNTQNHDLYIPDETRVAWQWITDNTAPNSLFLSAFGSGGGIAGRTGRHVVLGHWIETAYYLDKQSAVQKFFSAETDISWRLAFLKDQRVDYIWYSDQERTLGNFDPNSLPVLQ